jgi:AraC-like DNA-binding protein
MRHAPLLENRTVFRSRDPDETRAFLTSKDFRFDLPARAAPALDAWFNGVYLPGMYIGYVQYGAPVAVRAAGRDDYWIQFPLRGHLEVKTGGAEVLCGGSRAAVASPTRTDYYETRSDAGGARLHVCIWKHAMLARLAALLGEPPAAPIEFASEMDLTSGYGQSLARYLTMAVNDFARPDAALWSLEMMNSFEEMFLTRFLLSHPSSYSGLLQQRGAQLSPRDVKRAVDYAEAHLANAISIADLARAAGVPGRTLFKHFKDTRGVSPMRFVRNARFARVREALLRADAADSVTTIALGHGFTHMGRFSVEYRKRYGESPSETLRKKRAES